MLYASITASIANNSDSYFLLSTVLPFNFIEAFHLPLDLSNDTHLNLDENLSSTSLLYSKSASKPMSSKILNPVRYASLASSAVS